MGWRERAIEKMARAMALDDDYEWDSFSPAAMLSYTRQAAAALDALLAPETIPCPDCGGVGKDRYWAEGDTLAMKACPSCDGSGVVDGEPLLIARDRLEQVGGHQPDGDPRYIYDEPEPWEVEAGVCEPLYRLRDVNEGEEA